MGYRTPNIDRIAKEGANFTDFYGQQSCTAGRAAFITGQSPIRTGLTKVGMPGATLGSSFDDPTSRAIHEAASATPPASSARTTSATATSTCRRCTASTNSSATSTTSTPRRSPNTPTGPRTPSSPRTYGPRGVLKCKATDNDDATVDKQFGRVGKQVIENTGPLTKKRMETVDEEFLASALDFMDRKTAAGEPWFCYMNTTRMHIFTHLKPESDGKTGLGVYPGRDGRARRLCRPVARQARGTRRRRQHDRGLHHRQRRRSACPGRTAARRRFAARRTPTGKAAGACPA